ncbi:MAG: bifunctional phosphoribosyl-AMP cyclohydrolase/phosphoribosyl-ATP diphosphatase HisIE [Bacteroidetes bacterium]|nr:bifunctional phosphoribosyl-AMP cyclohydrolase/phosphoribosyl-ATP diphosphatase HisIE [Bacteroidota bacterium]
MKPDFTKSADGLLPAIVQDVRTRQVLMQAYMNEEAFLLTQQTGLATFWSRSRSALWVKGETSGHYLHVKEMLIDCDGDSVLIKAEPAGPVCHTGAPTCWNELNEPDFLAKLEEIIRERKNDPSSTSYTSTLLARGINKVAQKVGEEAVELVIEAKDDNRDLFLGEAADLLYHYLVLLTAKNCSLADVLAVLEKRHKPKQ